VLEFQRSPVRGNEGSAAQFVSACNLHLQLANHVVTAIAHRDAQRSPAPELESIGESHHGRDIHGTVSQRRRQCKQQRQQSQDIGQALNA